MRASRRIWQGNVDEIVCELTNTAPDENVRTIEVLAEVMARRQTTASARGLAEDDVTSPGAWQPDMCRERLSMYHRIARRAVGGCLKDTTGGANAFHKIGERPAWTTGLLPSAEAGQFLLYRR